MKKLLTFVSLLSLAVVLFVPSAAWGQQVQLDVAGPPSPSPGAAGPESVGAGIDLLGTVLTWISTIFWILAVIFILYAGFLYLTAAGDAEKVKKASTQLLYSVIAVAVALFATVIPTFVRNFLAGQ